MRTLLINLVISIILFYCSANGNSQDGILFKDSVFFSNIDSELISFAKKQSRLQIDYIDFVNKNFDAKHPKISNLIKFAYIFDLLVSKKIHIIERFPRGKITRKPLRAYIREPNNNADSVLVRDTIRKLPIRDESNEALSFYYFKMFCSFRVKYKDDFNPSDYPNLEEDIITIIKYGNFKFPITVRDILLNKYDHVKENKYYADMSYYMNN